MYTIQQRQIWTQFSPMHDACMSFLVVLTDPDTSRWKGIKLKVTGSRLHWFYKCRSSAALEFQKPSCHRLKRTCYPVHRVLASVSRGADCLLTCATTVQFSQPSLHRIGNTSELGVFPRYLGFSSRCAANCLASDQGIEIRGNSVPLIVDARNSPMDSEVNSERGLFPSIPRTDPRYRGAFSLPPSIPQIDPR